MIQAKKMFLATTVTAFLVGSGPFILDDIEVVGQKELELEHSTNTTSLSLQFQEPPAPTSSASQSSD